MRDDERAREIAGKLNMVQRRIMLRAPMGSWFPAQNEGWHWPWKSLSALGLVYPREPGMQTFSPLGLEVRCIQETAMMDDDAQRIVGELTEAERLVLTNPRPTHSPSRTLERLRKRKLLDFRLAGLWTPLGLVVRRFLEDQPHDR